jgi:hypothetical protein
MTANITLIASHAVPQPASGKLYYKIFPKKDIDTAKTREFIKRIVGADDLLP